MDILEVGELDPEDRSAMIWLGWHLEGEAKSCMHLTEKILRPKITQYQNFSKYSENSVYPSLVMTSYGPSCKLSDRPRTAEPSLSNKWPTKLNNCRSSYPKLVIGSVTNNCWKLWTLHFYKKKERT